MDGDNVVGADEVEQTGKRATKDVEKLARIGMLAAQLFEDILRSLVGLKLVSDLGEVLLVAPHVCVADFEKLRQRQVHYLVVLQLL